MSTIETKILKFLKDETIGFVNKKTKFQPFLNFITSLRELDEMMISNSNDNDMYENTYTVSDKALEFLLVLNIPNFKELSSITYFQNNDKILLWYDDEKTTYDFEYKFDDFIKIIKEV